MIDNLNHQFICINCKKLITMPNTIGTKHRNHCPRCLFSLHLDLKTPGDRLSSCMQKMTPIGLALKNEGVDKYGRAKIGEINIIHYCSFDKALSPNRIAADDNVKEILKLLEKTAINLEVEEVLKAKNIKLLDMHNEDLVKQQLFGKS